MTEYRPGGCWKRTLVKVGTQPPDEQGRRPDDELVGMVDDPALAVRICALLNGEQVGDNSAMANQVQRDIAARENAAARRRSLFTHPDDRAHIDITETALRDAAARVRAARPGVETRTALAVIQALTVMGWRPPPA